MTFIWNLHFFIFYFYRYFLAGRQRATRKKCSKYHKEEQQRLWGVQLCLKLPRYGFKGNLMISLTSRQSTNTSSYNPQGPEDVLLTIWFQKLQERCRRLSSTSRPVWTGSIVWTGPDRYLESGHDQRPNCGFRVTKAGTYFCAHSTKSAFIDLL